MIRTILIVAAVAILTMALLPFHLIGLAFNLPLQRIVPHLYHRAICRLIGVRIHRVGAPTRDRPALILSNHTSWLDICVITAAMPVVFVAKSEVETWPVIGWLARLQRTVFVERERRRRTGEQTRAIGDRLLNGDAVVLFAEGTSGDGMRVLPFRSALVGAVHHALGASSHHDAITVQPLSVAYTGLNGVPTGRALRERVAWFGDADLMPHLMGVLSAGAIDVVVSFGEPVAYGIESDRKQIARVAEDAVRRLTAEARRRPPVTQPQGSGAGIEVPSVA